MLNLTVHAGFAPPGSFSAFQELSDVKDETQCPSANQMLEQLATDHAVVIMNAKLVHSLASELDDEVTADLMTQRISIHEKTVWMLNSLIDY